jgi:hypothetical protein
VSERLRRSDFTQETQKRRHQVSAVFLMLEASPQDGIRRGNLVHGIGKHGHR